MIHNSSRNRGNEHRRLIDFLEDRDFREWVMDPESKSVRAPEFWAEEVSHHAQARQARYILRALKAHFERQELSGAEIESRLELEIDRYRQKGGSVRSMKVWNIGRIAAALALLVGLFFLILWMNRPYDVYTTDFGEQLTIQLPDESIIQLNSNSTLTWDRDWDEKDTRAVTLEGEAFFDVKQRDGMPFRVHTADMTIHVIGTQFNVNSRRSRSMVYLDEGKVNVEIKARPDEKYEMAPGEELVYRSATGAVEQKVVDAPEEISGWKEGVLVFRDEPLLEVLKSVSDIYGKEFVLKDTALIDRNITTTIPLTNWDVSLTAIQLAMRLSVEEQRDTVWLQGR